MTGAIGVKPLSRDVEDAFLVLEGSLAVGSEENGEKVEVELGPRDLVKTQAGSRHWFRNNGAGHATVWYIVGSGSPELVKFEAA